MDKIYLIITKNVGPMTIQINSADHITIPADVLEYDSDSFDETDALTGFINKELLVRIDTNLRMPNDCSNFFRNCRDLIDVKLNTEFVTNMFRMFNDCTGLQNPPTLDTRSVRDMCGMFDGCTGLQNPPALDTRSVRNMSSMFSDCINLQNPPAFDTRYVMKMDYMFNHCTGLQNPPMFDTRSVINMSGMFKGCIGLQNPPVFDTRSVQDMTNMFYRCTGLQNPPAQDTRSVWNMSCMFKDCTNLRNPPTFDTRSVMDMSGMFWGCTNLRNPPAFDTSSVILMTGMLDGCVSLLSSPNPRIESKPLYDLLTVRCQINLTSDETYDFVESLAYEPIQTYLDKDSNNRVFRIQIRDKCHFFGLQIENLKKIIDVSIKFEKDYVEYIVLNCFPIGTYCLPSVNHQKIHKLVDRVIGLQILDEIIDYKSNQYNVICWRQIS